MQLMVEVKKSPTALLKLQRQGDFERLELGPDKIDM